MVTIRVMAGEKEMRTTLFAAVAVLGLAISRIGDTDIRTASDASGVENNYRVASEMIGVDNAKLASETSGVETSYRSAAAAGGVQATYRFASALTGVDNSRLT
jgi:hypothetical protein